MKELKTLAFKSGAGFRAWLLQNHDRCEGIWLRIYRKDSGKPTVAYAEALDQALCFGWIDGLRKSYDRFSFIQRFTPRRARSVWSKLNTQHVERLTASGLMMPAGLLAVEAAKSDGRWESAYSPARSAELPKDFLRKLNRNKKARSFFATLNRANVYAVAYRLQTAKKPETRSRRMDDILAMLNRGERFH